MTQHNITPPPELVQQWQKEPGVSAPFSTLPPCHMVTIPNTKLQDITNRAALWGADQELKACCEFIYNETSDDGFIAILRAARRPKPKSEKQQALDILNDAHRGDLSDDEIATIRRAVEQLDD